MDAWTPPKATTVKLQLSPHGTPIEVDLNDPDLGPEPALGAKFDRKVFNEHERWKRRWKSRHSAIRAQRTALIDQIAARFDLGNLVHPGAKLKIGDPRWPAILEAIEQQLGQGVRIHWFEVTEPPPRPAKDSWYHVIPGNQPFTKPSRMRPTVHLARQGPYSSSCIVASQRFIDVVRDSGLTGLDSLPLVDVPDNDPLTWYQVFATAPVGRGLNHVLMRADTAALKPEGWDPDYLAGWAYVGSETLRRPPPAAPVDLTQVLRLLKGPYSFGIHASDRLVREFLPATDFAYRAAWGRSRADPTVGRAAGLFCSARAREALMQAGLMGLAMFDAIEIVAERDADVEVLDRRPLQTPPPSFTPEEAVAERRRRLAIRAGQSPTKPALTFATVEAAARYLMDRLASGTATWKPTDPNATRNFMRTHDPSLAPRAWQTLLPLLPRSIFPQSQPGIDGDFGSVYLVDGPGEDSWEGDLGPMDGEVEIGFTGNGDWFAINPTDPAMPDDARVVWWDHETLSPHEEWPSILAFVADMIETCDRLAQANPAQPPPS